MRKFVYLQLILVSSAADVATPDPIPPPLGDMPPALVESAPAIEVIETYSLPNPDAIAVDPTGTFFVSGTKDGYVYKTDIESGDIETIFSPKDFRPDYFVNQTDEEVRGLCDGSTLANENTCGRVLGVKFDLDGETGDCNGLWMANSYFGIYEGTCGAPWEIVKRVAIEGGFVNDIQPLSDGEGNFLYYTITHQSKTRNELPYVVLDTEMPSGSFHRLETSNYTTEQLGDGIYFANGLATSSDEASIFISETTAARILRYDIMSGEIEPFLENLPILPDNIVVQDGELLVPGYTRNEDMETFLKDPAALIAFSHQFPDYVQHRFKSMIAPQGNLVIYDESTGRMKEQIFQADGGLFSLASSATRLDNGDYVVGSIFVPAATRFRILPHISQLPSSSETTNEDNGNFVEWVFDPNLVSNKELGPESGTDSEPELEQSSSSSTEKTIIQVLVVLTIISFANA